MTHHQEKKLLLLYQSSKNIDVLGKLYSDYMPLVYGVCLKYLKNRELAQDAVMDIFEKLTTELLKHDLPDNFKTWLYVVTKNFCLMKLRKDGSESRAFKKMSLQIMENGFELHPLDKEENVDLTPTLKDCIEKLKAQQKHCVELFYFKKLCYREIAETLNIPEKKVKSDIQNGKRNLKLCIEQSDEFRA